jgi:hypothetical protein
MHDAFQNRRLFLNQDLFYRKAERRRRWRNFFSIKRLLSANVDFFERRLLYIFEIYRVQNRFRASYVRNFIFLDYFDLALKRSNRMIVSRDVITHNTEDYESRVLMIKRSQR